MKKLNRILLIDDDDTTIFINEKLLKNLAITKKLVIKKNGREALNYLKNASFFPELIFVDLHMPVMDGIQFLSELNLLKANVATSSKVVAISSIVNATQAKCIEGMGFSFIIKPLTKEKILKILSNF